MISGYQTQTRGNQFELCVPDGGPAWCWDKFKASSSESGVFETLSWDLNRPNVDGDLGKSSSGCSLVYHPTV